MFIIQSGNDYYMGGSYEFDKQRIPYTIPYIEKAKKFNHESVAKQIANTINGYQKGMPEFVVVEVQDV